MTENVVGAASGGGGDARCAPGFTYIRVSQPFKPCGPLSSTYTFRGPLGKGLDRM